MPWKECSCSSKYEVNHLGQVRNKHTGKVLKPYTCGGYHSVDIGHRDVTVYVHRLVAEAFLPIVDGCNEVNHKDGNKHNNMLDNLEWSNRVANLKHAVEHGLQPVGEHHPRAKLSDEDVASIRRLKKQGKPAKEIATKYNITARYVHILINNRMRKVK